MKEKQEHNTEQEDNKGQENNKGQAYNNGGFSKNEDGVGKLIKEVNVTLGRNRDRHLACLDLTSSQIDVLLFLVCNANREMNQRAIEHEFFLTNPTVTGILNRLEKKGFIVRNVSSKDRRNHLILLTEKAKAMQEDVMESRKYVEQLLTKGMTAEEIKILRTLLKIMRTNLMND